MSKGDRTEMKRLTDEQILNIRKQYHGGEIWHQVAQTQLDQDCKDAEAEKRVERQELIDEIENHSAVLDPQKGVDIGKPIRCLDESWWQQFKKEV
jgi:hypothetical protein